MRIASDFKDYYDVGMSAGQDQTLVYTRYRKKVDIEENIPYFSYKPVRMNKWQRKTLGYMSDGFVFYMTTIGFCGKLYPVFEVNLPGNWGCNFKDERETRKFCFSLDDIDSYVKQHFSEEEYNGWGTRGYDKYNPWPGEYKKYYFDKFFKEAAKTVDNYGHLFEEHQVPVFNTGHELQSDGKCKKWLSLNCCLKNFEFFRVFDHYAAYQEISMFLGNMAEPRKPVPHISDEILCEAKGFDQFSFRQPKGKKPRRKHREREEDQGKNTGDS